MADYLIDYRLEKEKRTKLIIPPKVLLIRSPNEKKEPSWLDGVMNRVIDKLEKRHIGYTTDIRALEEEVNLSIVFIDKEFLINSSRILDHVVQQNLDNDREFTFVIDESIFDAASGYPKFCSDAAECRRLEILLDEIYCKAAPFKPALIRPSTDRAVIRNTIHTFVDDIVDYVNPYTLNFSELCPDLVSHVACLSATLYAECVIKFPLATEPPLIAILEQGCRAVNTTTVKLLYTFVNNMVPGGFFYRLYIDLRHSGYIDGGPRPSLFNALAFAIHQNNQFYDDCEHLSNKKGVTFFVVIDGLDDFLSKKEDDPAKLLAKFVNELGEGSLVIATSTTPITSTIPVNTFIQKQTSFGFDVQSERQWPKCFIILNSQLNELVLNQQDDYLETKEEVDEMGTCEEDKKEKNVHSINFALSGNVPKKLKEAQRS